MRALLRVQVRGRQLIRLQKMHSQTHCGRTRLHAQIVLLSHDGYSIEEIAQITRQSGETVRRWLHRFSSIVFKTTKFNWFHLAGRIPKRSKRVG
jgi:Homeodomain-like domain